MQTPEYGVKPIQCYVNFEQISHIILAFPLLILDR